MFKSKIIKRMRCTHQKQTFEICELENGQFRIMCVSALGKYSDFCKTFADATNWVWNMADNHDISGYVIPRMCDKWGLTAWGEPLHEYEWMGVLN